MWFVLFDFVADTFPAKDTNFCSQDLMEIFTLFHAQALVVSQCSQRDYFKPQYKS